MTNSENLKALVQNPYNGKVYDFTELFRYLNHSNTNFIHLSEDLKETGDIIPQILTEGSSGMIMNLQNLLYTLNRLRDIFRDMEPV